MHNIPAIIITIIEKAYSHVQRPWLAMAMPKNAMIAPKEMANPRGDGILPNAIG